MDNLLAQQVAETGRCGEEERIANPFAAPNGFLQIGDDGERGLNTILIRFAIVDAFKVRFPVKAEDVRCIRAG